MTVLLFFIAHWYASLFCQSFFLHRYGAHGQFAMSKFWERFFFLLTVFTQGASYMNPRAYIVMHRLHHEHSDGLKDPHSPWHTKNPWAMMGRARIIYIHLLDGHLRAKEKFYKNFPSWKSVENFFETYPPRIVFVIGYITFYAFFANHWWLWFLLPIQIVIGPIQGAIVNWCGHKYGSKNFDNGDKSRNTWWLNLFLLGETNQNNHHKFPARANFGYRWYEFDPLAPFIWFLDKIRVIRTGKRSQKSFTPLFI